MVKAKKSNNSVNLTQPIWIEGNSYCGKTTRLVEILAQFQQKLDPPLPENNNLNQFILIFCANNRGRILLQEKINEIIKQPFPYQIKTPLAFIIEQVELFFPLIIEKAKKTGISPQIPLRLRPETEQELATQRWHPQLKSEDIAVFGNESNFVRRCLDLMQLAGCAGIPIEDISNRLEIGLDSTLPVEIAQLMGKLILEWRSHCLDNGLLTYGLIYELFLRYLLENDDYKKYLYQRYLSVFADDLDDYPAISGNIINLFHEQNKFLAFTYNLQGKIRLGLNADPDYLSTFKEICHIETLENSPVSNIFQEIKPIIDDLFLFNNTYNNTPSSKLFLLKTRSRTKLLTDTAEYILNNIKSGEIQPSEIAIIAPGLDEITRFTLIDKFNKAGITAQPLQEQRPLITSPIVRAILTLLGLLFQGLGRLVEQDAVAEMLIILSTPYGNSQNPKPIIDPVRAGLLADNCYHIDVELPTLLPFNQFHRWDRLKYSTVQAYTKIQQWIEETKQKTKQQIKKDNFYPLTIIEQIIDHFFPNSSALNQIQQSNLREFIETAQHFWQVEDRLQATENNPKQHHQTLAKFIILLRKGTITANPFPSYLLSEKKINNNSLIISNIYQYRSFRGCHRWQFWLDIGSYLWNKGGASELFAYQLFLKSWQNKSISPTEQIINEEERLKRIIKDLSARATEKVFFCHSDLAINGNEQINSPLLTLSNLATVINN